MPQRLEKLGLALKIGEVDVPMHDSDATSVTVAKVLANGRPIQAVLEIDTT